MAKPIGILGSEPHSDGLADRRILEIGDRFFIALTVGPKIARDANPIPNAMMLAHSASF